MKVRPRSRLAVLVVLLLSAFGTAASERYSVSAELTHQGKAFAAPSMVVRQGEPATVEVSGANGYRLALTVRDSTAGKIEVAAAVESAHGAMAPTVVVKPGVPASVTVGDLGIKLTVDRSDG